MTPLVAAAVITLACIGGVFAVIVLSVVAAFMSEVSTALDEDGRYD